MVTWEVSVLMFYVTVLRRYSTNHQLALVPSPLALRTFHSSIYSFVACFYPKEFKIERECNRVTEH